MVATEDTQTSELQNATDNTGAFEKLKQTLSSSLLTAQDKGNYLLMENGSERHREKIKMIYDFL